MVSKHSLGISLGLLTLAALALAPSLHVIAQTSTTDPATANAAKMLNDGKQTFRFDTFGDEAFWGDALNCTRRSRAAGSAASGAV